MTKNLFDLIGAFVESTCCFTGYRPHKLPWGLKEYDDRCFMTRLKVKKEIEKAIACGYKTFISGMALGFDMMSASIVLELKRKYPDIQLVCAIPCKNQDKYWGDTQKIKYKIILEQADLVLCLHERYTKSCMEERNRYIINNSSLVIALFDGQAGGTANTIKYAKQKGKEIVIVEPVLVNEDYLNIKIDFGDLPYEYEKNFQSLEDIYADYVSNPFNGIVIHGIENNMNS
ncbi:MAG: DUF1273 family protein [Clostridia bacterium]|nr:DUF1273 family protein [Clostridia bacterium]